MAPQGFFAGGVRTDPGGPAGSLLPKGSAETSVAAQGPDRPGGKGSPRGAVDRRSMARGRRRPRAPVLRHDAPPVAPAVRTRECAHAAGGPPDAGETPRLGGRMGLRGASPTRRNREKGGGGPAFEREGPPADGAGHRPVQRALPGGRCRLPLDRVDQGTASGQVPESRRGGGTPMGDRGGMGEGRRVLPRRAGRGRSRGALLPPPDD